MSYVFVYVVSHFFPMAEYLKGFIFYKINGLVSHSISLGQVVYSPYWPKDIPKSLHIALWYRPCLKPGVWMTRWTTKGSRQVSGRHSCSQHSGNMWLTLTLWVGAQIDCLLAEGNCTSPDAYKGIPGGEGVAQQPRARDALAEHLSSVSNTCDRQGTTTCNSAPEESMPLASSATLLKCIRFHTHKHN